MLTYDQLMANRRFMKDRDPLAWNARVYRDVSPGNTGRDIELANKRPKGPSAMTTRTSSPVLHIEDQLIGHTADRERIFASVRIDRVGGSEHETTNHETVSEYLRFSFTWLAVEPRRKMENAHIAGCGTEWSVDAVVMPAQGFTIEQIRELGEIAKEWHTNDLNAACDHQTVVWENGRYGRQPSLTLTEPCEITGYRYGTSWLVKSAPDDLVQRVAAIFGKEVMLND